VLGTRPDNLPRLARDDAAVVAFQHDCANAIHAAATQAYVLRGAVPHTLVRRTVEVLVGDEEVTIFDGATVVARHRRGHEPYARVAIASHFDGLWRRPEDVVAPGPALPPGRSLADYAAAIGGAP